jgi:hypothetical protein
MGNAISVLFALGSKFRHSMNSVVLRRLQPINQCYGSSTWETTQMFADSQEGGFRELGNSIHCYTNPYNQHSPGLRYLEAKKGSL